MNTTEKLARAEELRAQGNAFYNAADFKRAIRCYHEALLHVNGLDKAKMGNAFGLNIKPLTQSELDEIQRISVLCHNNLAVCVAKDGKWDKVVTYCSRVLEVQPDNAKALFRRGDAYVKLRDIDRADTDLQRVLQLEPNDPKIRQALAELRKLQDAHAAKERQMFKGLFAKMSAEPDADSGEGGYGSGAPMDAS